MDAQTKVCRECREQIDVEARRCPKCQSWQSWKSNWSLSSPQSLGGQLVIWVVLFALMIGWFHWSSPEPVKEKEISFESYRSMVTIAAPTLTFGKEGGREFFAVVGTINNQSAIEWRAPYIEARFFNAKNEMIDTMSLHLNDTTVLPGSNAAYRLSNYTTRPSTEYSKVTVNIVSAHPKSKWE